MPCPVRCHSNHPLAGTRHRRERNAASNDGLGMYGLRPGVDEARTHLGVFPPRRAPAPNGAGQSRGSRPRRGGRPRSPAPERRCSEVGDSTTALVPSGAVEIVNLTPGQLLCETATHRRMLSVPSVSSFLPELAVCRGRTTNKTPIRPRRLIGVSLIPDSLGCASPPRRWTATSGDCQPAVPQRRQGPFHLAFASVRSQLGTNLTQR